ncbi:MAG: hypothetical protein WCT04_11685 [Planctomycetota bacterium]
MNRIDWSLVWTVVFGMVGLTLMLKTFRAIISGEMVLLFWRFKRTEGERAYGIWMGFFALLSLVIFFIALRFYLGPVVF